MPSAVDAAYAYVVQFPTHTVPAQAHPGTAVPTKLSALGVAYPAFSTHTVKAIKRQHGRLRRKAVAVPQAPVTQEDLLTAITTHYAYLLKPSEDGSHYVIDLSSLGTLRMRKRYRSLGVVLRLTPDLKAVDVQPTDTTLPTNQLAHLASVALAVYTLLKEAVVKIWSAVAPTFATAVASVASAVVSAASDVAPGLVASVASAVSKDVAAPTPTQVALFPFQSTVSEFLEKVDAFMLGARGLLTQLTGIDYGSLVAYLKAQLGQLTHTLPTALSGAVAALPVIKLGAEYFQHFVTYVEDALAKRQLDAQAVDALLVKSFLPADWTVPQKLAYVLWNLSYYNTLVVHAFQTTFAAAGSALTQSGQSAFAGLQAAQHALSALLSFKGTTLVGASEVLATPVLARKFISVKELVESDPLYAGLEALSPAKVSLCPV